MHRLEGGMRIDGGYQSKFFFCFVVPEGMIKRSCREA